MKPISAHREHVFPIRNDPKQSMNSQTANAALKQIGFGGKLVAHGLSSIASTAMNEEGFSADVVEATLGIAIKIRYDARIIAKVFKTPKKFYALVGFIY